MQFYQITQPEIIDLYKEGEITTSCAIRLYIKVKFAPGWKIVIDRDEVLEIFDISIHAFRRAIAKLKNKLTIFIKSVKQVATASVKKVVTSVNNVAFTAKKVTPSVNYDPQTTNKINASEDSPNIRSNIDHISLSEKPKPTASKLSTLPAEEREKFLDFAMDRVNQLPKRPSLPSKWIAANFDDLYSEFKLSSAPETQEATNEAEFQEWSDLMKAIGKITRKYQHKGKWVLIDVCGREIEYEDYRKSYTLEYLRKCAGGR
jgi:hypothetical protein